jgi:N-acetylglucosamine kinase-like BadF-type ATPase
VLVHDTPIAHAGALGGRAGVVVIAGTGSVVYGDDGAGWSCTLGGWGFLFGDEGSAFAIAHDALAMLMRAHDEGAGSLAEETRVACEFFEVPSLRRLAHAFYKMEVGRDRLAAFAPEVMRFEALREPADRGADRLAQLVATAIAAGAAPRVAFVGGVFSDARFRQRLGAGILHRVPQAEIVDARYQPVEGALLLAYRQAGLDVTELVQ